MLEAAENKLTTDGLTAFLWFKPLPMLARWEAAFFMGFRMTQLTLGFDTPARISRKSDPITSQKSAAETERRINTFQGLVLQAIKNASKPITANEAAREAAKEYVANIETFRKRVRELVRLDLVEECDDRKCEVTGKSAMTFRVKEQRCREN